MYAVSALHRAATGCVPADRRPPLRTTEELRAGVQEPPAVKAALAVMARAQGRHGVEERGGARTTVKGRRRRTVTRMSLQAGGTVAA